MISCTPFQLMIYPYFILAIFEIETRNKLPALFSLYITKTKIEVNLFWKIEIDVYL